jgi:DNA-binding transcriptional LysR family regulator
MELRHLRAFLTLAEELHFGRAARRLHVVQSAVSQTIRALEEEVGAPLFLRVPRKLALTQAGSELLPYAHRALAELDEGAKAARGAASGDCGQLSIALGPLAALTSIPRRLAAFQRHAPGVRIAFRCLQPEAQLVALREGRLDLGFIPMAKHDTGSLKTELIESAPVVAVLGRGHRLAGRPWIALSELSGERLLFPGQLTVGAQQRRHLEDQGFEPAEVIELDGIESLLALVESGLGVALLPGLVRRLGFPGMRLVPLRPVLRSGIIAVWSEDRLAATAARFLELLRAP